MKRLYWQIIVIALFLFSCSGKDSSSSENEGEAISTLEESEEPENLNFYNEDHRPQFHFSNKENWMNDPNGMFYYNGTYHLFYQYYPDSTVWGPMHWGHATSEDLVIWKNEPVALYPDELGYIFSGSCIVDFKNTSGLGSKKNPPIVALYTYHNESLFKEGSDRFQYQGLAYSNDNGETWEKYKNNPVLANPGVTDFRDPKVIWHGETEKWVMVLAAKDHVEFYGSSNLIDWSKLSDFGLDEGSHDGVWECPDLIKVKIDGTKDQFKWVLIVSIGTGGERGSATQYFTGEFDGTYFVSENKQNVKWIDEGWDNYAGVTWFKETDQYEPPVFIGWMNNWEYAQIVPTEKWRGAMTIPRKLSLFASNGDLFIRSYPIENLSYLRTDAIEVNRTLTNGVIDLSKNLQGKSSNEFDFELLISEVENPGSWEIVFSNTVGDTLKFGYDHIEKVYFSDRSGVNPFDFHQNFPKIHYGKRKSTSAQIPVRLLLDRSSIEIFADLGEVSFTDQYFARRAFSHMQFIAKNQPLLLEGMIYPMKSIWN